MKTKEELDLLLEDLSSRLPYGVQIEFSDGSIEILKGIWYDEDEGWQIDGENTSTCLHAVKPLLFPMSTMSLEQDGLYRKMLLCAEDPQNIIKWLNERNLDYRGLIEKDLAKNLEAIV